MQAPPVKVVLANPPLKRVIAAATPEYVGENSGCLPPIGLLSIQAAVEHSRHQSVFVDANAMGWDHDEAARQILSHGPDLVGIQAMTFTMPDAYLLARALKSHNSGVKVALGGPHPTIYPRETAALEHVDFAFAGESEISFIQFLDAYGDEEARAAVAGVASKHNGDVRHTPSSGLLSDLDVLAYPARRSSPYGAYRSILARHNPITVMITSRGCPFNCVFCNRMGRKYRAHSAQHVLGEVDDIAGIGIREIFVHDDTFSLNRARVTAICEGLIERRHGICWEARTRVDCVDEPLLALMRKAGCVRLSFGVESGSERVLRSLRKGIDLGRVKNVFAWCRREGIMTLADFMIGSLDEELSDVRRTLDFAREIDPDYAQYSICSPFPGTPLYAMGLETGMFARDIWLEFARDPLREFACPVWTQHFTEAELVRLTAQAYREFYLRPRRIMRQLTTAGAWRNLPSLVRAGWGMLTR